jgi:hypothetical protein
MRWQLHLQTNFSRIKSSARELWVRGLAAISPNSEHVENLIAEPVSGVGARAEVPRARSFKWIAWLCVATFAFCTAFSVHFLDVHFFLAKGMTQNQITAIYGKPDQVESGVLTFWRGGHNVNLRLEAGRVSSVSIVIWD